jgi:hypothetical protein
MIKYFKSIMQTCLFKDFKHVLFNVSRAQHSIPFVVISTTTTAAAAAAAAATTTTTTTTTTSPP